MNSFNRGPYPFNPLVSTAPLVAHFPHLSSIARVIDEIETNGKNPKIGPRILHQHIFMQLF